MEPYNSSPSGRQKIKENEGENVQNQLVCMLIQFICCQDDVMWTKTRRLLYHEM